MNHDEAAELEREFGVVFPAAYRVAITRVSPQIDSEAFVTSAESLRYLNRGYRDNDPLRFPWKPHYWCIGEDGAGGFYFINTNESDSKVFYCDHEDVPSSIDDTDRMAKRSFEDYLQDIEQQEKEYHEWNTAMTNRTRNRRWWQFWVPRDWPQV